MTEIFEVVDDFILKREVLGRKKKILKVVCAVYVGGICLWKKN